MRLPPVTALLFCSLLSAAGHAAPWYRVEMMLIAYENETAIDEERWADALASPLLTTEDFSYPDYQWWQAPAMYRQLYTSLWAGYGFSAPPQSELPPPFTPLDDLALAGQAERINKRSDMKVVWHQAWIEPIQEAGAEIRHPVSISLQDKLDIQITGTFWLQRSRYLHLNTDLLVQHYVLTETGILQQSLMLPESVIRPDYRTDLLAQSAMDSSSSEPFPLPVRAAEIRQTRRMRSGELHYIDHPMLGIVIKIIPLENQASADAE